MKKDCKRRPILRRWLWFFLVHAAAGGTTVRQSLHEKGGRGRVLHGGGAEGKMAAVFAPALCTQSSETLTFTACWWANTSHSISKGHRAPLGEGRWRWPLLMCRLSLCACKLVRLQGAACGVSGACRPRVPRPMQKNARHAVHPTAHKYKKRPARQAWYAQSAMGFTCPSSWGRRRLRVSPRRCSASGP